MTSKHLNRLSAFHNVSKAPYMTMATSGYAMSYTHCDLCNLLSKRTSFPYPTSDLVEYKGQRRREEEQSSKQAGSTHST